MSGPIDRVDAALGHLLERLTVYHHRKGIPVRELVWAGAPRPLLRPWRGDGRKLMQSLDMGTGFNARSTQGAPHALPPREDD